MWIGDSRVMSQAKVNMREQAGAESECKPRVKPGDQNKWTATSRVGSRGSKVQDTQGTGDTGS